MALNRPIGADSGTMWRSLLTGVQQMDIKAIARSLSLVENEAAGYQQLLQLLPAGNTPVIGITGPPGAGKSTLVDALIAEIAGRQKKVAVLCIDPSSPFNRGALLGDRIRMSQWYTDPHVFIRSLASRGSLGGLNPRIIEMTDVLKAAPFDFIIVETVGVGQSEIEITGLADTTVVVVVPEAGDEVQTMKAGLMEIADVFVVNKADRPDADRFVKNLRLMLAPAFHRQDHEIAIIKTIASQQKGIGELYQKIMEHSELAAGFDKKSWLLTEKAWHLIQQKRMSDVTRTGINEKITAAIAAGNFNLYAFVEAYGSGM